MGAYTCCLGGSGLVSSLFPVSTLRDCPLPSVLLSQMCATDTSRWADNRTQMPPPDHWAIQSIAAWGWGFEPRMVAGLWYLVTKWGKKQVGTSIISVLEKSHMGSSWTFQLGMFWEKHHCFSQKMVALLLRFWKWPTSPNTFTWCRQPIWWGPSQDLSSVKIPLYQVGPSLS